MCVYVQNWMGKYLENFLRCPWENPIMNNDKYVVTLYKHRICSYSYHAKIMDHTTSTLLDQVLEWLGQDIIALIKATIDVTRVALNEFLKSHIPEWTTLVTDVVQRGLEWGRQELEKLRPMIMKVFTKHSLRGEIPKPKAAGVVITSLGKIMFNPVGYAVMH